MPMKYENNNTESSNSTIVLHTIILEIFLPPPTLLHKNIGIINN